MTSFKRVLSVELPTYLVPAKSTFDLFIKYLKKSIQTGDSDTFTLTYLVGLQVIQTLLQLHEKFDSEDEKQRCSEIITEIISPLEQIKTKQTAKNNSSRLKLENLFKRQNKGSQFLEIISDENSGRLFLNKWCLENLEKVKKSFANGTVDGEVLATLIDLSAAFQVSLTLFPFEEGKEEQQEKTFDDENPESPADDKEQDVSVSQDDHVEDKPNLVSLITDGKKQHELNLNLTKNNILAKVKWCNYHTSRILECLKQGKDPNEDLVGLLSQPPQDYEEIPQEKIDSVLAECLNSLDLSSGEDDEDFNEEDYYYDSDEGEYIHKSEFDKMEQQLPSVPSAASPAPEAPTPSDTRETSEETSVATTAQTPANMIAKESHFVPEKPVEVDLDTLKKQLANEELLSSASKCCRFAMSAINYEDVQTAISELKEAIDLLQSYNLRVHEGGDGDEDEV